MGTYTQIAKVGADATARRRSWGGVQRPVADDAPAAAAAFVCPTCEDTSVVASTCVRCDVEMADVSSSVALSRHPEALPTRGPWARALSFALRAVPLLLGVAVAYVLCATRSTLQLPAIVSWSVVGLVSVAAGVFAASWAAARASERLAGRWVLRWRRARLRARAKGREARALAELQREDAPVRVRGQLRVERRGGELRLALVDDDGHRAWLPIGARLVAYEGHLERSRLHDGELVEVVGLPIRERGAGRGYRDADGELAFDSGAPCEVWVERSAHR